MSKVTNTLVGQTIVIPQGTRVYTRGSAEKQERTSEVTVRAEGLTRAGNQRIVWKRNGYKASAVIPTR